MYITCTLTGYLVHFTLLRPHHALSVEHQNSLNNLSRADEMPKLSCVEQQPQYFCCFVFVSDLSKYRNEKQANTFPSQSLCAEWSNEEVLLDSAQWIAGHQAEMSSERQWIILFKDLLPMEWGRAQNHHFGIRQTAWHAVRGFCCCDISLDTCSLCLLKELKERKRPEWSGTEHTSNTYLSPLRLDIWPAEQTAHWLVQSFVWLKPVNEGQSLPAPAGPHSNQ